MSRAAQETGQMRAGNRQCARLRLSLVEVEFVEAPVDLAEESRQRTAAAAAFFRRVGRGQAP